MLKARSIILICAFILIYSCSEGLNDDGYLQEGLKETQEYYSAYNEPDYPAKEPGKYISSLYLKEAIHMGGNGIHELNILEGTKVKFNYNQKNYVKTIEMFDFDNQLFTIQEIEYNSDGKVYRIKIIGDDNRIESYDKFEYDPYGRLIKRSTYENIDSNNIFELGYLYEFEFPSENTVLMYFPLKSDNFERAGYNKFLLDSLGNVEYYFHFRDGIKVPYDVERYFYSNNHHRIYSETGLPKFYLHWGSISEIEAFSPCALYAKQDYEYTEEGGLHPVNEMEICDDIIYDCTGYPVYNSGISIEYVEL